MGSCLTCDQQHGTVSRPSSELLVLNVQTCSVPSVTLCLSLEIQIPGAPPQSVHHFSLNTHKLTSGRWCWILNGHFLFLFFYCYYYCHSEWSFCLSQTQLKQKTKICMIRWLFWSRSSNAGARCVHAACTGVQVVRWIRRTSVGASQPSRSIRLLAVVCLLSRELRRRTVLVSEIDNLDKCFPLKIFFQNKHRQPAGFTAATCSKTLIKAIRQRSVAELQRWSRWLLTL